MIIETKEADERRTDTRNDTEKKRVLYLRTLVTPACSSSVLRFREELISVQNYAGS